MDRATLEAQWAAQTPTQRFRTAERWLRADLAGATVQAQRVEEVDPEQPELLAWVTVSHPSVEPPVVRILLAAAVFREPGPGIAAGLVEVVVLPWARDLLEAVHRVREQEARERWNAAARAQASASARGLPKYAPDYSAAANYYLRKWAQPDKGS